MIWHSDPLPRVLEELNAAPETGLTEEEARTRQESAEEKRLHTVLTRTVCSPMTLFLLLLCAAEAGIAWYQTAHGTPTDALPSLLTLLCVLLGALCRGAAQAAASRVLAASQNGIPMTAAVRRGGRLLSVADSALVPGDILCLAAGDSVPADCRLLRSHLLICDETAVGGDAHVQKNAETEIPPITPLSGRVNMLYRGTLLLTGEAEAVVAETGGQTEYARLHPSLCFTGKPLQPVLAKVRRVGTAVAWAAVLGFWIAAVLRRLAFTEILLGTAALLTVGADWLSGLWLSVYAAAFSRASARGIALRSEALAGSIAGADRAVVRVDDLALSAEPELTAAFAGSRTYDVHSPAGPGLQALLRLAVLCTEEPARTAWDRAILACAAAQQMQAEALQREYPSLSPITPDADGRRIAAVRLIDGQKLRIVRGAPEELLPLCRSVSDEARQALDTMRQGALRVLAVAYAYEEQEASDSLLFAGLLGFALPTEQAARLVSRCRAGQLTPCLLTEDSAEFAGAYASAIGWPDAANSAASRQLWDTLSDGEWKRMAAHTATYADLRPADTAELARRFRASGITALFPGQQAEDRETMELSELGCVSPAAPESVKEAAQILLPDLSLNAMSTAAALFRDLFARLQTAFRLCLSSCLAAAAAFVLLTALQGQPPFSPTAFVLLLTVTAGGIPLTLCGGCGNTRFGRSPASVPCRPRDLRLTLWNGAAGAAALTAASLLCTPEAAAPITAAVWMLMTWLQYAAALSAPTLRPGRRDAVCAGLGFGLSLLLFLLFSGVLGWFPALAAHTPLILLTAAAAGLAAWLPLRIRRRPAPPTESRTETAAPSAPEAEDTGTEEPASRESEG